MTIFGMSIWQIVVYHFCYGAVYFSIQSFNGRLKEAMVDHKFSPYDIIIESVFFWELIATISLLNFIGVGIHDMFKDKELEI